MGDTKGYKICDELKDITPQIIREWDRENRGELMLVKRQIFYRCPLTDMLVSEGECRNCTHNYGTASPREIYCMPNTDKIPGARSQRERVRNVR